MLRPFRAKWFSVAFHSEATRTIAFSLSFVVIALLLGNTLLVATSLYAYLYRQGSSTHEDVKSSRVGSQVIAVQTAFLIAFLMLIFRCCWRVWGLARRSIPRGLDLLLQCGEIGFVFWRVFVRFFLISL
ncbi:hypothetical protein DL96DRAFT_1092304 [Flagelloscypha sp. PMI_526]|nr:hypothetical protein DL96DRAFT_1092304 [Flagelloscypha sp. PMI_526]